MDILKREAEKNHAAKVKLEKFLERIRLRKEVVNTGQNLTAFKWMATSPVIRPQEGEIYEKMYGDITR